MPDDEDEIWIYRGDVKAMLRTYQELSARLVTMGEEIEVLTTTTQNYAQYLRGLLDEGGD